MRALWFVVFSTVSIRNHVSSLKHTIRHQQAQLQNLETLLHRSSYFSSVNRSKRHSPPLLTSDLPPSSYPNFSLSSHVSLKRRSASLEALQNIAGRDSLLPLPKQDGVSIREGVPTDFASNSSQDSSRRSTSPTRSLSRTYKLFFPWAS